MAVNDLQRREIPAAVPGSGALTQTPKQNQEHGPLVSCREHGAARALQMGGVGRAWTLMNGTVQASDATLGTGRSQSCHRCWSCQLCLVWLTGRQSAIRGLVLVLVMRCRGECLARTRSRLMLRGLQAAVGSHNRT